MESKASVFKLTCHWVHTEAFCKKHQLHKGLNKASQLKHSLCATVVRLRRSKKGMNPGEIFLYLDHITQFSQIAWKGKQEWPWCTSYVLSRLRYHLKETFHEMHLYYVNVFIKILNYYYDFICDFPQHNLFPLHSMQALMVFSLQITHYFKYTCTFSWEIALISSIILFTTSSYRWLKSILKN